MTSPLQCKLEASAPIMATNGLFRIAIWARLSPQRGGCGRLVACEQVGRLTRASIAGHPAVDGVSMDERGGQRLKRISESIVTDGGILTISLRQYLRDADEWKTFTSRASSDGRRKLDQIMLRFGLMPLRDLKTA
jgi:hypothetical protein